MLNYANRDWIIWDLIKSKEYMEIKICTIDKKMIIIGSQRDWKVLVTLLGLE